LKHSLSKREKELGPSHREVADSLSALADVLIKEGKYARAEKLAIESLSIRMKALGPNHPDVARSLEIMSASCRKQGMIAEAEELARRSSAISPAGNRVVSHE
jgi:hypothetical protein